MHAMKSKSSIQSDRQSSVLLILVCLFLALILIQGSSEKQTKAIFNKDKPFEILNSERGITDQSSASDTNMCKGWNIPGKELPGIIKDCEAIDGNEWHYLFDHLPCIISGKVEQNKQTYKFEINAGSWLWVFCPDTVVQLGNFKKENEKYFLSKAWEEDK